MEKTPIPGVLLTETSIAVRRSGVSIISLRESQDFKVWIPDYSRIAEHLREAQLEVGNTEIITIVEEITMVPETRYHNAIELGQSRSLKNSPTGKVSGRVSILNNKSKPSQASLVL